MFYFDDFYGKKILKSTKLKDFDCFFTTRNFVLTPSNRTDLEKEAEGNRIFLKNKLNCDNIITAKQIHSSNISIVEQGKFHYEDTDALISDIPDSLMILNFADCVPIILYDKKNSIAAIVHAGWRGTEKEIAKKTSVLMQEKYGIKPEDITALIGPSIGKCCFETNEDVFDIIIKDKSKTELYTREKDKYHIDLKLINKHQLTKTGIIDVDICDYCTCCMSDIFFSYRKENGITARHSAVVKIKRG